MQSESLHLFFVTYAGEDKQTCGLNVACGGWEYECVMNVTFHGGENLDCGLPDFGTVWCNDEINTEFFVQEFLLLADTRI